MEEPRRIDRPNRWQRSKIFLGSSRFKLYCSYFLSSWGDRMWSFALSIALGVIGGDLQYTAASGLVNSATVLLFASLVGRWVDRTPRLKAARTSLIFNNSTVASSAAIFVIILFFPTQIGSVLNGALITIMIAASIILCAASVLANVGTKICITKDWVVVICGTDKEKLAGINAMMVRIDQTSMVLSPLVAGQIIYSLNIGWGCAFIGFWNVSSFIVEYYMLWAVYKSCPALAVKIPNEQKQEPVVDDLGEGTVELSETPASTTTPPALTPSSSPTHEDRPNTGRLNQFYFSLRSGISSVINGYRIYFRQSVLPAGLSLATLYLTVLGFDGITTVYILSLGLAENLIAVCRGLGAVMGIMGSLVYPRLHRRIGIHRTGLIALTLQWTCLLLPVASVWLPGSNFDPGAVFGSKSTSNNSADCTGLQFSGIDMNIANTSSSPNSCNNGTTVAPSSFVSKCSLAAFITGIILSRMGLWMADLSISQIFQENIAEHERGVVNGVQNALNSVMDIVKSILVIILPDPRTFGILIIISWAAVFLGYCSYCYFCRRIRGHLIPFHNQLKLCISKSGHGAELSIRTSSPIPSDMGGAYSPQGSLDSPRITAAMVDRSKKAAYSPQASPISGNQD